MKFLIPRIEVPRYIQVLKLTANEWILVVSGLDRRHHKSLVMKKFQHHEMLPEVRVCTATT